jgi:hypothetical protein
MRVCLLPIREEASSSSLFELKDFRDLIEEFESINDEILFGISFSKFFIFQD